MVLIALGRESWSVWPGSIRRVRCAKLYRRVSWWSGQGVQRAEHARLRPDSTSPKSTRPGCTCDNHRMSSDDRYRKLSSQIHSEERRDGEGDCSTRRRSTRSWLAMSDDGGKARDATRRRCSSSSSSSKQFLLGRKATALQKRSLAAATGRNAAVSQREKLCAAAVLDLWETQK